VWTTAIDGAELLGTLLDSMLDAVCAVDADGRVLFATRLRCRSSAVAPGSVVYEDEAVRRS
jgi:PAS domain-containing protein